MDTERDRGWLHYAVGIVLMLLVALGLSAQEGRGQTVDIVSPPWRLYTADTDSTISLHNEIENAIEAASLFARANPGRSLRMMPAGPWRIEFLWEGAAPDTIWVPAPPDTVFVEVADTVVIPCNCEEPGEPPVDPPTDPDEPDEPPVDPPTEPGDTVAPPADTTITYPPATDPTGAFFRIDWDYAQLHDGGAGRYPTTYGPDNGYSRQVTLSSPGPWGGVHALRNTFLPMPRTTQPQVGTRVDFPFTPRLWLETWVRFSPNWTVQPTFRFPDRPDQETGNVDHKTLFVFAMTPGGNPWGDWDRRWDVKFGPNGEDCVASGGQHPTRQESFYMVGYFPPQAPTNWDEGQAVRHLRCRASQAVWDGQWHQLRVYVETTPTPTMKVWLDGRPMVDSDLFGTMQARSSHRFYSIWFGGNRNSGPTETMWFEYGPALLFSQDPGWGG